MSTAVMAFLLTLRSDIRYGTGRLDAARRDAQQAVDLCPSVTDARVVTVALLQAAKVDAVQGRSTDCVARLDRATEIAAALPDLAALAHLAATRGLLRLGEGAWDDAVRHLERAEAIQADHGPVDPLVVGSSPRLIEAYVACGRHADAGRQLGRLRAAVGSNRSDVAQAVVLRAEALTAPDAGIDGRFRAAAAAARGLPAPFEEARLALLYGERLRRVRRRRDAQAALGEALESFERMGAAPWAARSRRELRAAGYGPTPGAAPCPTSGLTPQEREIARIVAEGATNRATAARLFLSPKTVDYHLGHIYRKLDLRSRTELARVMAAADADGAFGAATRGGG